MSELHESMQELASDRASYSADPVRNLRTGANILAEIEPVDPILAQAELGEDAREVVCLHVDDDTQADGLRVNDQVQFRLFGRTVKYRIVKRRNNAANVFTDFWATQITTKDT